MCQEIIVQNDYGHVPNQDNCLITLQINSKDIINLCFEKLSGLNALSVAFHFYICYFILNLLLVY